MNQWSAEEIVDWQNERLRQLVNHAYYNTKYYHNVMKLRGLLPKDIKSYQDLKKLPVLKKQDILDNQLDFISSSSGKRDYIRSSTGGSTGDPLRFLLDKKTWSFTTANRIYSWGKFGYRLGNKYVALGSSSLFPVNNRSIKHQIYYNLIGKVPLNAMNVSEDVLLSYLKLVNNNDIKFIYGYASAIYLLAKCAIKEQITSSNIKGCFPTSEILLDKYRGAIESAFNCKVMDFYGAHDGGISAFEIEKGYYHVGYNCILEIDKENNEINTGKLLTTDLINHSFPFIRYEIGDEATLLDRDSVGNRFNGQVIGRIWGRTPDIIRLENGRVLTGPGFTILFKDLNVRAYRIKKAGRMKIECEIQKGLKYKNEEESLIISTFKKHGGQDCDIQIRYVEQFETSSSGKRRYFISE